MSRTADEFMARFRGVAAHRVTRAVSQLTPSVNWIGCSKSYMAYRWASGGPDYRGLKRLTLDAIAAEVKRLYPS